MSLHNKNILLGITGGIAAYKCAHLVRLLIKEGAHVKVIMTKAAEDFITPKTLSVLSKNEVFTGFFNQHKWNDHVHLAQWAHMQIIAPLTANTLAKLNTGICDNLITACYLSAKSPVFVAPAMDLDMYKHPTIKKNLRSLKENGTIIIPAENGELASGLVGEGRMAEPENIVNFIKNHFKKNLPFAGKKILVNAGPTYEAIDPVRFIGNRSSGKTGIAIAEAFAEAGAEVTLVLGPTASLPTHPDVTTVHVESAAQMHKACLNYFKHADIAVLSAAVSDYRPEKVSSKKIKKTSGSLSLNLVKNPDILSELGKLKKRKCLVGFALETEDLIKNAKQKLTNKKLDIIIANLSTPKNKAFGTESNRISILDKHNKISNFELKTKTQLAKDIVNYIQHYLGL